MAQFLRPTSTVSIGLWTDDVGGTTNIHLTVDEATADDLDFIRSPNVPVNEAITLGLSAGSTPDTGTKTLRVRARKSGGGEVHDLTIDVMEGAAVVQTFTMLDLSNTAWVAGSFTVTNAISDWSNVRVRFSAFTDGVGTDRRSQVSWTEFEIPDAAAVSANMPPLMRKHDPVYLRI